MASAKKEMSQAGEEYVKAQPHREWSGKRSQMILQGRREKEDGERERARRPWAREHLPSFRSSRRAQCGERRLEEMALSETIKPISLPVQT